MTRRGSAAGLLVVAAALLVVLLAWTRASLLPLPDNLLPPGESAPRAQVLDRDGRPLALTYGNAWNRHELVALHDVPLLLRQAFVAAEDRRFFDHAGVDHRARLGAAWQNLRAVRGVRGASTLSEQVVRMLHPRKRTLRSRWLEGFEARRLERRFSKGEILEFYLNQVPYARQRRGVAQAARDYFDRDLETLSPGEMLALAVLVRRPDGWDLRRSVEPVRAPVRRLAEHLLEAGAIDGRQQEMIVSTPLVLRESRLAARAPHFVRFVRDRAAGARAERIHTFLDATLQQDIQGILDHQLTVLARRRVTDGAVLVVDHQTDRILAWVNAGDHDDEAPGSQIDAILTPRQPGSTLKPFVYAAALESGWTASTLIDDSPLAEAVGQGLHRFRNYSRHYHGPVRLREALGNSLNVPAVRALQAVGAEAFHARLRALGFESLDMQTAVYGDGLALGNGEVTLFELVGAYAALARGGVWRPLLASEEDGPSPGAERRVYDEIVSSLIGDILADPDARRSEFGSGGALEFPQPTAVKTGTSNDFRDAWALGYSDRFTAGVWMGNLDRQEMDGVSGAVGPALVLRAVFSELRRDEPSGPLFLSRKLRRARVCRRSGAAARDACPTLDEWFGQDQAPQTLCATDHSTDAGQQPPGQRARPIGTQVRLLRPTPGLHMAMDPRIPDALEAFELELAADGDPTRVEWSIDGTPFATTTGTDLRVAWPLSRGAHTVSARVWYASGSPAEAPPVSFLVK